MRRNRTGLRVGWMARIAGALLLGVLPARAIVIGPPFWCGADCNGDGSVAINEIITCVNVALGAAPPDSCPACDSDRDGVIAINDLVEAVGNALRADCFGEGEDRCGDGALDPEEMCDDGNTVGGDGCAANCTVESARLGSIELRPRISALPVVQRGQAVLRTGQPRATATGGFTAGDIPVALRAEDLRFEPERIPGLVCVCARAVALAGIAANRAGTGVIHCGPDGGTDLDYRVVQDHNTTPGDPHNRVNGTPDDPECDDTAPGPAGTTSRACREGSAEPCPGWGDAMAHPHTGVCNGPRVFTFSGGAAARGSAQIAVSLATTTLADAGACATTQPMRDGACRYPDYGPDCLPCTDDDTPSQARSDLLLLTTGTADGAVFDTDHTPGPARDTTATSDPFGGCFPFLCVADPSAPFDCDALAAAPTGGLGGAALGFAVPLLDASLGDLVAKGVLSFP